MRASADLVSSRFYRWLYPSKNLFWWRHSYSSIAFILPEKGTLIQAVRNWSLVSLAWMVFFLILRPVFSVRDKESWAYLSFVLLLPSHDHFIFFAPEVIYTCFDKRPLIFRLQDICQDKLQSEGSHQAAAFGWHFPHAGDCLVFGIVYQVDRNIRRV